MIVVEFVEPIRLGETRLDAHQTSYTHLSSDHAAQKNLQLMSYGPNFRISSSAPPSWLCAQRSRRIAAMSNTVPDA
jgi:hypothetical protein